MYLKIIMSFMKRSFDEFHTFFNSERDFFFIKNKCVTDVIMTLYFCSKAGLTAVLATEHYKLHISKLK